MNLRGNSALPAYTHATALAVQSTNTPALRLVNEDVSLGYKIKASVSAADDFGLSFENESNATIITMTTGGEWKMSGANRGLQLQNLLDDNTYRIYLDNEGNIVSQNLTGTDRKLNSDIPTNIGAITYNLDYNDTGHTVWMNRATASTANIPLNAAVAYNISTTIMIMQEGLGQTTIQAPVGVTLNGVDNGSCTIEAQYTGATLIKRGTDAWVITGNISAVA
jgi:hypothetical protein